MIGLGSQYLTAAGFGRYKITAESLGNLDLLGTYWLDLATLRAILGAFGDDGKAVIKATNAYLNGIAASDRDKATALAGFINEDPMMVCSLGLEPQGVTMPIRTLNGDGIAYIYTNIQATDDMTWKLVGKIGTYQGEFTTLLGFHDTSDFGYPLLCWRDETNKLQAHRHHRVIRDNSQDWKSQIHTYEIRSDGYLYIDGQRRETWGSDITYLIGKVALFRNSMRTTISKSEFVSFETTTDRDHKLVPMKRTGGNCGVMDLETGNFYGNSASSGTLTIPDISYTPSTP